MKKKKSEELKFKKLNAERLKEEYYKGYQDGILEGMQIVVNFFETRVGKKEKK